MAAFQAEMNLADGTRIIDLGGQPMIWDSVPQRLDITIVNLPGVVNDAHASHHTIRFVEGDACDMRGFADGQFDIAFSNSVIEHVGSAANRANFAKEAQRLARFFWVQTPSKYFPIEAHTGMPFWWWYPASLRKAIISSWEKKLPDWTEMIKGTTYLSKRELTALFPGAKFMSERFALIPKSMIVYKSPAR